MESSKLNNRALKICMLMMFALAVIPMEAEGISESQDVQDSMRRAFREAQSRFGGDLDKGTKGADVDLTDRCIKQGFVLPASVAPQQVDPKDFCPQQGYVLRASIPSQQVDPTIQYDMELARETLLSGTYETIYANMPGTMQENVFMLAQGAAYLKSTDPEEIKRYIKTEFDKLHGKY